MKLILVSILTLLVSAAFLVCVLKRPLLRVYIRRTKIRRSVVALLGTASFCLLLATGNLVWSNRHKPAPANTLLNGEKTIWTNAEERLSQGPKSGPLKYEILTHIDAGKPLNGRIAILTPETDIERIIQLNDTVLAKLRKEGDVDDKGQVFYLDYFDDKTVALTYFDKQADKKTSSTEKRLLLQHFVATMVYHSKFNIHYLSYIPTAKIIKQY